jgi:hypothetical protein
MRTVLAGLAAATAIAAPAGIAHASGGPHPAAWCKIDHVCLYTDPKWGGDKEALPQPDPGGCENLATIPEGNSAINGTTHAILAFEEPDCQGGAALIYARNAVPKFDNPVYSISLRESDTGR